MINKAKEKGLNNPETLKNQPKIRWALKQATKEKILQQNICNIREEISRKMSYDFVK